MKNNRKKEKIDIRKYINFALLMIAIVLAAFIAVKLYNTYQDNKLKESVFARIVNTLQYDDIDNLTREMPSDGFILVSYVKNQDTNKFESELKKSVISNELQNNFYYLDATDMMLEKDYISSLNNKFQLEGRNEIKALPAIIYYREGKIKTTISSEEGRMLTAGDFEKLLDSYELRGDK